MNQYLAPVTVTTTAGSILYTVVHLQQSMLGTQVSGQGTFEYTLSSLCTREKCSVSRGVVTPISIILRAAAGSKFYISQM